MLRLNAGRLQRSMEDNVPGGMPLPPSGIVKLDIDDRLYCVMGAFVIGCKVFRMEVEWRRA